MWGPLSITGIAILVGSISRFGFLFNSDVVNGGYLTLIGVGIGGSMAFLFFAFRERRRRADRFVIDYGNTDPWFKRKANWLLIIFFSTSGAMIGLSTLNRVPLSSSVARIEYSVVASYKRRFRVAVADYVSLSDGHRVLEYQVSSEAAARLLVGRTVVANMRRGFLGFSYIEGLEDES